MQIKGLSLVYARVAGKIQRTGWRDAGLEGPHPKMKPGTGPLAAMPPGVRGTLHLAATSIGRGRKYSSAAICREVDDTD